MFLKTKVNLNKNSKILDIGCGRANIISALQKKHKFKNKPTGIDVVANKDVKRNIVFKKIEDLKYLKKRHHQQQMKLMRFSIQKKIYLKLEIFRKMTLI